MKQLRSWGSKTLTGKLLPHLVYWQCDRKGLRSSTCISNRRMHLRCFKQMLRLSRSAASFFFCRIMKSSSQSQHRTQVGPAQLQKPARPTLSASFLDSKFDEGAPTWRSQGAVWLCCYSLNFLFKRRGGLLYQFHCRKTFSKKSIILEGYVEKSSPFSFTLLSCFDKQYAAGAQELFLSRNSR